MNLKSHWVIFRQSYNWYIGNFLMAFVIIVSWALLYIFYFASGIRLVPIPNATWKEQMRWK